MKIDPVPSPSQRPLLPGRVSPGIYPYLGGAVATGQLRSIVDSCGCAVVSGLKGARLAGQVPGALLDPAQYNAQSADDCDSLFVDFDVWLKRQQAAEVPVILTDTPRIRHRDRSALHGALGRWELLETPTLVVLPIEPWWLTTGLAWLIEEVRAAGRPVAIVLLASFNGLDAAGAVQGLLAFISEVEPVPVVLLRSDISAVGAVAYGASAGFVGWSPSTRHGPLPMPSRGPEVPAPDNSPSLFVPALHDYFKASKLPALARFQSTDVLRCDDHCCGENGLREIADLSEFDRRAARTKANQHSMVSADLVANRIFDAAEPRDAWWETCKAGTIVSVSLVEDGISVPAASWLRQWLAAGSPSHASEAVG